MKPPLKRKLIVLLAVAAVLLLPLAAQALIIPLSTEFAIPAGPGNYGQVTLTDLGTDVQFSITYPAPPGPGSMGTDADLQYFLFNINPNPGSGGLPGTALSSLSITGTYVQGVSYSQKADGDGTFDYQVDFGNGASPATVPFPLQTASFIVSLTGYDLSIANFADGTANTKSAVEPGNGTTWTVAAHWQNVPYDGADSFWVGGNPGAGPPPPIPVPPSVWLLGSGLVGLGLLGWRRKSKT